MVNGIAAMPGHLHGPRRHVVAVEGREAGIARGALEADHGGDDSLHVLHANQVSSVFRRPKTALPALLAKSNLYVCRRLALCVALAFTMTA